METKYRQPAARFGEGGRSKFRPLPSTRMGQLTTAIKRPILGEGRVEGEREEEGEGVEEDIQREEVEGWEESRAR